MCGATFVAILDLEKKKKVIKIGAKALLALKILTNSNKNLYYIGIKSKGELMLLHNDMFYYNYICCIHIYLCVCVCVYVCECVREGYG